MDILDIIPNRNLFNRLESQLGLGLAHSLAQNPALNGSWIKQIPAYTMQESIIKNLGIQHAITSKYFSGLDSITKSAAFQVKLNIPPATFETINLISKQQEQIFGNIRTITNSFAIQNPALTQINSLQIALSKIAGQIGASAILNKDWTILKEFENINEQVLEITNNLSDNITFTEEENIQFKNLIDIIVSFIKRNKSVGINSLRFVNIILIIAGLHQYYDFLKQKPELASKLDIERLNTKLITEVESKLKEEKEYRTTNRDCRVMLKPYSKTLVLDSLPTDFDVIVLQVNHKWVYVSYINISDNLPQTGWILKKYLAKP